MNKETKEIYLKYCQLYTNHANQYADLLTGSANHDFYSLLQSEYKKDLKETTKRERERLRAMNKLMKLKLRADKRILRSRKAGVDYDFTALIDERMKAATKEYLAEIFNSEQSNKCETCSNFAKSENDSCGCVAYNLVFNSDELRKQFCTCFCTAYKQYVEEETSDDEENMTSEEFTEETIPPDEQKPADNVAVEPKCCRECGSFIDDDDGCFCNKYGKYINDSDVDSICCCECDDFFDDEEDDPE